MAVKFACLFSEKESFTASPSFVSSMRFSYKSSTEVLSSTMTGEFSLWDSSSVPGRMSPAVSGKS